MGRLSHAPSSLELAKVEFELNPAGQVRKATAMEKRCILDPRLNELIPCRYLGVGQARFGHLGSWAALSLALDSEAGRRLPAGNNATPITGPGITRFHAVGKSETSTLGPAPVPEKCV